MTTTLRELIDEIRERARHSFLYNKMSEGKTFDLTDKLIAREINNGQRIFCLHSYFYRTVYPLITTARKAVYDIPRESVSIDNINYHANWRQYPLTAVTVDSKRWWKSVGDYDPSAYDLKYNLYQIELFPAPRYSGEIVTIEGAFLLPDLSLDNETEIINLPPSYVQAVRDYALAQIELIIGLYDPAKVNSFEASQKLTADFAAAAELCRRKSNFKGTLPRFVRGI